MLSPLVTKKLFILVETFQIGIVVVLMFILEKDVEDMLLYQGVLAFELFTNIKADKSVVEAMRKGLKGES